MFYLLISNRIIYYVIKISNLTPNIYITVYEDDNELKRNPSLFNHFTRQREGFFSAQSLKRFVRDELVDESEYETLKEQVNFGIADRDAFGKLY